LLSLFFGQLDDYEIVYNFAYTFIVLKEILKILKSFYKTIL